MPSLVPGYEYDIFISYRQNDNRYDGWVRDFVSNLKFELEATVKGKVSIYFDENPIDGLLEGQNVDASLLPKLHALIFMPIVSQTYCDTESFAWSQEFLPFLKIISNDKFSPAVKLASGNVANRVLPIRIHDLDANDIKQFEDACGFKFRPIDFIYKEPGVNRPLRTNEDSPGKNLNQTLYRNQINKVANAVKEIVVGLTTKTGERLATTAGATTQEVYKKQKPDSKKALIAVGVIIIASLLGYVMYPTLSGSSQSTDSNKDVNDKSIAVIPFADLSATQDQRYFADGMMDEILNHLYKIGDLRIPSRTTSMRYRDTKLSAKEIAKELGVTHILEGSVRRDGDVVRITIQLINGEKDEHEWSEEYNRPMLASQLLAIQSDVAQQVAKTLKAKITAEVKTDIERVSTENTSAYTLYLKFKSVQWKVSSDSVKLMLDQILEMDPNFAPAVASLGFYWMLRGGWMGDLSREQVIDKALPLLRKALELDSTLVDTHGALARFHLWYEWDFRAAEKEFNTIARINPNSFLGPGYYSFLKSVGRSSEMLESAKRAMEIDPHNPVIWDLLAESLKENNQCPEAVKTIEKANSIFNHFDHDVRRLRYQCLKDPEVIRFLLDEYDKEYSNADLNTEPLHLAEMATFFYENGQPERTKLLLNRIVNRTKISAAGSPSWFAARIYAVMNEKEQAFRFLEKSFADHEVEMYWLKSEERLVSLHDDPRWERMIAKLKYPAI